MTSPSGFAATQDAIAKSLVAVTRSTNALCAEDLPFHRSFDRNVSRLVDEQNARLLQLSQRLLAAAGIAPDGPAGAGTPQFQDIDGVEGKWREIVDVVDGLLERADTSLDEYGGYVRRAVAEDTTQSTASVPQTNWNNLSTKHNLAKPQRAFEVQAQNFEKSPFKPFLTTKPHAQVSLEKSLGKQTTPNGKPFYPHPYEAEIQTYSYPSSLQKQADPIPYLPWETTTATLVDTPEALDEMLEELKKAEEIAIDLEHHDARSYVGLVSLMQISTRDRDWIVDTLKPWRRRLECLNEVFTDPKIVKVLHGAHMDVIWLQRDLGLYLVGLFDTFHACEALEYPQKSLAALLKKFVNFNAQKQYQTADWRQRPLPPELFEYARADTHFLLYVFDCLRNELAEQSAAREEDLLEYVLESSKETALQRYEHPVYDAVYGVGQGGWYNYLSRKGGMLSKEQFAVFRAVHEWRDQVARHEDESTEYVLKTHTLMEIARSTPTDAPTLLSLLPPNASVARARLQDLLSLISNAKSKGTDGPEMYELLDKIYNLDESVTGLKRRRPPRSEAQPAAPQASIPPVAQAVSIQAHSTPKRPILDGAAPARAHSSGFWGKLTGMLMGRRDYSQDVRLTLPMPEVDASEPLLGGPVMPVDTPVTPATRPPDADISPQTDDVFVIRQHGGLAKGKKRTAAEAGLHGNDTSSHNTTASTSHAEDEEDEASGDSSAESADMDAEHASIPNYGSASPESMPTPMRTLGPNSIRESAHANVDKGKKKGRKEQRAAMKASKNARRKARKARKQAAENAAQAEQPFDYANAASVLNPAPDDSVPGKAKKHKKKVEGFNPYKRAMDAPKGLPKVQKPAAGRSGTWLNGA